MVVDVLVGSASDGDGDGGGPECRAMEATLRRHARMDAETALAWGLVNRVVEPEELLPAALKLAADMATIPAETLATYKAIIDQGYALPFGEGLALEGRLSGAHNRAVTPEMVEQRREAVRARGRGQ